MVFSIVLFSCNAKEKSVGYEDEISIIADTADYITLKPVFNKVFNKIIYTPQPEKLFEINRFSFEKFDKLKIKEFNYCLSA